MVFSTSSDLLLGLQEPPKKPMAVSLKKTGGAFQPFEREKHATTPPATTAAASNFTTSRGGGDSSRGGEMEKKEEQSPVHRKARRCWSPELHRLFLHALERLGGSHGIIVTRFLVVYVPRL